MTEEKKKNPIAMALEAKKKNAMANSGLGKAPKSKGPKANSKGFGGASVVRRAGRGG
jgi:hypothetical protein